MKTRLILGFGCVIFGIATVWLCCQYTHNISSIFISMFGIEAGIIALRYRKNEAI